ncbi:hypothetical protein QFC21_002700 [Naganishia friedmannii]|uniref:Uncharacterized protein n=1 Tax=Naganishia friedmannii TaxID=89922 RepID=A0ACC2VXX6_9TREE|nr:hypothetical protein QFC21_002700 [Naganishia friedmannii]
MPSSSASSSASAFLKILNQTSNPSSSSDISDNLKRLRRLVLTQGIPDDPVDSSVQSGMRARVWKLLLRIDQVSAGDYLQWVDMGPSEVSAKNQSFKGKVREDMLIRLLEAFAWKSKQSRVQEEYSGLPPSSLHREKGERSQFDFAYVQGMNVLSAPFLYVLSTEIEAFACFSKFIETCCPTCLQAVDTELYAHLKSKNLSAELPMKILRIYPPLQASSVISITVALVKDVPEDLYGELVKHTYSL